MDPAPPHDPEPHVFGDQWWLQIEIETSDQWVLFSGAKLNYRRRRVVVWVVATFPASATEVCSMMSLPGVLNQHVTYCRPPTRLQLQPSRTSPWHQPVIEGRGHEVNPADLLEDLRGGRQRALRACVEPKDQGSDEGEDVHLALALHYAHPLRFRLNGSPGKKYLREIREPRYFIVEPWQ